MAAAFFLPSVCDPHLESRYISFIEELRVDIKSHHGIKSNSSYSCIKYDLLLPLKIKCFLVLNSSVIEPNAFSFITVW